MRHQLTWRVKEVAHASGGDGAPPCSEGTAEELVCRGCGVVCSGAGAVLRRGTRPRKVHTSSGVVEFALRQVTCPACRVTWCPFLGQLGLAPYQRVIEELEQRCSRGWWS
jgi:hypothetical protein